MDLVSGFRFNFGRKFKTPNDLVGGKINFGEAIVSGKSSITNITKSDENMTIKSYSEKTGEIVAYFDKPMKYTEIDHLLNDLVEIIWCENS